ncbi:MAG TPA: PhpK family radical SAM P-methyltransferase [Pyrinomonadaceae bacterium]|jgi:p-methyltransferase
MRTSDNLDCVIIGHNDMDFREVCEEISKIGKHSGAYNDLKANSVLVGGERITYMELLNRTIREATGTDPGLYATELPHLGSAYLASFMRRRGLGVEVVNSFNQERERLKGLLAQSPRAVAITTTLYVDYAPIVDVVNFVRRHNPRTKIIVGGPHVFSICSDRDEATQDYIFQEIGADIYIFDSQGELTLSKVLAELRDAEGTPDLSGIPNLTYTHDNLAFERTPRVVEDNDMDENAVDWSTFDPGYYAPTAQLRTARSCAFKCAFCRYPAFAGSLNLTSIEVVERELRQLHAAGVKNVVFIDDTFNVPLPRFKELCRMMIRNRFDFNWFSFFRCANADDESFDLMAESGCKGVFLGIESGDARILKNMNKFADPGRYSYGIARLKERGILTFATIIVGYPGENEESIRNTTNFLLETCPTYYRLELYYHYTNVPIHEHAEKYGIRGSGYSWKHNSMDWREAAQHLQRMYRTIEGPRILPGYMFDFWSIPYLMGKGLTLEQIEGFVAEAQGILVQGFDESAAPDTARHEERMRALFRAPALAAV